MSRNAALVQVREAIRNPYAWPGGYPVYVVLCDGARLCPQCARNNYRLISEQTHNPALDCGWGAIGAEVFWEGADDYCADCNAPLPSAYGPVDSEE
jgi:hypothetical protein